MARYRVEIFETYAWLQKPVLRERRDFFVGDDASAVAEAIRLYDELAKDVEDLKGFALYKGSQVVYERSRRTAPS